MLSQPAPLCTGFQAGGPHLPLLPAPGRDRVLGPAGVQPGGSCHPRLLHHHHRHALQNLTGSFFTSAISYFFSSVSRCWLLQYSCVVQASKRVDRTSRYFRRLGVIGFWGQLVCSLVAAVILAFSIIIHRHALRPVSAYLTFVGILSAFASVFWSFGYLRMADRLNSPLTTP